MPSDPKYLTVREAASVLGVTVERVRQLCDNGKLPYTMRPFGYRAIKHIARRDLDKRLRTLKSTLPPDRVSS